MDLTVVEFSASHLSAVQSFDCGRELWAELASDWIKQAPPYRCALASMQKYGTSVWLYVMPDPYADEKHLVGFSSLGVTQWAGPLPGGEKRELGHIPMLAVASAFQGKPDHDDARRYSRQIMEHVIAQAIERRFHELCLKVHCNNERAIGLYRRFGFQPLGPRDGKGNIGMLKLLD